MSGAQVILREYLLSLGFKVSGEEGKKFTDTIGGVEKFALGAGKALVSMGLAAAGATVVYARGMEKLFYASQRTGATAGQLDAVKYAFEQIGLSGGQAISILSSLSDRMLTDPGLVAFMKGEGINTALKGGALLLDIVDKLNARFPGGQGSAGANIRYAWAEQLGLDMATMRQIESNRADFEKAMADRTKRNAETGNYAGQAAKNWRDLDNALRRVEQSFVDLTGLGATKLIPVLQKLGDMADTLSADLFQSKTPGSFLDRRLREEGGLTPLTALYGWIYRQFAGTPAGAPAAGAPAAAKAESALAGKERFLASLETRYGLPHGSLDALWSNESSRGLNAGWDKQTGRTAFGDFQFKPKMYDAYGPQGGFSTFEGQAQAAARLLRELLGWSGGDLATAFAGYNRGRGNFHLLDGDRLGNMPRENQDYVRRGMATFQQTNTIIVQGGQGDVADRIARRLEQSTSDLVRNRKGNVR